MNATQKVSAIPCRLKGGGWGIKVNGEIVVSTSNKPFKTKESAESGIRFYLSKKDERFFVETNDSIPASQSSNAWQAATEPYAELTETEHAPATSELTPATVLAIVGHSPSEPKRPKGMSSDELKSVFQVYADMMTTFSHDQLSCLSTLLHRYDQAWLYAEQLEAERVKNAGFDHRTAWKYENKASSRSDLDDMFEEVENV